MPTPKGLVNYPEIFTTIAEALTANSNARLELPMENKATATRLRLLFYGFRRALQVADPDPNNPIAKALGQTQVTIKDTAIGTYNIVFERNASMGLTVESLKALSDAVAKIVATGAAAPAVAPPTAPVKHTDVLEQMYGPKEKGKD